MNIIADTHTHTIASTHAFSTILENAAAAAALGLYAICMTDHAPKMLDAPHIWHFHNLGILPRKLSGVTILRGVEVNIMDYDGGLDMTDEDLRDLEWVVASMHSPCITPGTTEEHTRSYLALAQNPYVDVIGHSGGDAYKYDYVRCLKAFKEYGKLVEINENSFRIQKGAAANYVELARLCKQLEVPIVVNSDAHFTIKIGDVSCSMRMLEEIDFPKRLILNADRDAFCAYVTAKRGNLFEQEA